MINGGRWAITGFYALGGIVYTLVGLAMLWGHGNRFFEAAKAAAGEDSDLVTRVAGIFVALVGAFLVLTGWGIYRWRRWARWVVIAISTFNLGVLAYAAYRGASPPMNYILVGAMGLGFLYWAFNPSVERAFASGGLTQ
ncbi:MAG: hypothetical protein ACRD5I_15480 [Candidatus Acidiferrales bacterium]